MTTTATSEYALVDINTVHPHPRNVRRTVDGVDELAASIKAGGLHQPLVVAPADPYGGDDAGYILVMGHRRHAAAQSLGWSEVPCVIRYDLDTDAKVLEAMLAENMSRSDLTPTEEGDAFQALLDLDVKPAKIAKAAGRSAKHVKDRAAIARALTEKARIAVDDGQITIADALSLAKIDGDVDHEIAAKVEAAIGTPNFRYTLEKAIGEIAFGRKRARIIDELTAAGATITDGPASAGDGEVRIFLAGRPDDVTADDTSVYVSEYQPWSASSGPRVQWVQIRPREEEDPTGEDDLIARDDTAAEDEDDGSLGAEEAARAALREEENRARQEAQAARDIAQATRHRWLHEKWREGMRADSGVIESQLRAVVSLESGGYRMQPDLDELHPIVAGPDASRSSSDQDMDPARWSLDKLAFATWWLQVGHEQDRAATRDPAFGWDDETVEFLETLVADYDYPLSTVETELIAHFHAVMAERDDQEDG